MDLFDAIAQRHCYREPFAPQGIPRPDLQRIVEAGLAAPSGCNAQTTRFVIVDEPALVQAIRALHTSNKAMQTAPAYIACIVDRQPEAVYEGHTFQVEDCAAAVENMLLAITALGYAAVWVDGWLRLAGHAETIGGLLGVPPGKLIRVILPVGVPGKPPRGPAKKPFADRAHFNRYGDR